MSIFERYLTVWVFLCIVIGIALGQFLPGVFQVIGGLSIAQVNLPVGILIWIMIIPMLVKVDFGALGQIRRHVKGIGVTLFVNWLVKPFSMALLGWLFIRHIFAALLPADQLDSYIAGLILLAAAPCTAMVFVWSRLTNGDPLFTLSQVALNDSIMVVAFAPLVGLLLGISAITVPWGTLLTSVVLYIVIPVALAQVWRGMLLKRGVAAFEAAVHRMGPWSIGALLTTLVLLFAFQGEEILQAAARDCAACSADPRASAVQLRTRLLVEPRARRKAQCGVPFGPDRRIEFFRARGGRCDQSVWISLRCGARHGCRRADRGSCHAACREYRQQIQRLVRTHGNTCDGQAMTDVTIYHNPSCGTSRNTLALIRNAGVEPTVIEYLKSPPDRATLESLIQRMGIRPRELLRQKGTPYDELGLDADHWTDAQLIEQMLAHPILINRPIVVTPWGVKLCRPSETVLDILPLPQKGPFAKEDGELLVDSKGRPVR